MQMNPVHYIVGTLGSYGDIIPFLEIARVLQERGERVSFVTNPYYEEMVLDYGLAFLPVGKREEHLAVMNDPKLWGPQGAQILWRALLTETDPSTLTIFRALDRRTPVVFVSHLFLMPAVVLASNELDDLRIVACYSSPILFRSHFDSLPLGPLRIPGVLPHVFWRWFWRNIDRKIYAADVLPRFNRLRLLTGQMPVDNFVEFLQRRADLYMGLFPEWFGPWQTDWPKSYIAGDFVIPERENQRELDADTVCFLARNARPLIFTFGTGNSQINAMFETACAMLEQHNQAAVFVTRFREQLPHRLPPRALWLAHVPLEKLMAHASVLIHHGGIGTMTEAMRSQVPQVVIPQGLDQQSHAMKVKALGLGTSLLPGRCTARTLLAAINKVRTDDYVAARCRTVAAEVANGRGVQGIVDSVLAWEKHTRRT